MTHSFTIGNLYFLTYRHHEKNFQTFGEYVGESLTESGIKRHFRIGKTNNFYLMQSEILSVEDYL